MRTLYLLLFIYTGLFLSACSTLDNSSSIFKKQKKQPMVSQTALNQKDPLNVAVFNNTQPTTPYTVLGKAIISEYNPRGIKRQEACVHDAMRNLAATMGGDAVINLNKNDKIITGTVIAFENENKQKQSSG